jgi:ATP-dependent helicase HrpB
VSALGAIVLSDDPLANPNPNDVRRVVCDAIVASEFQLLNWTQEAAALRARLAFLHEHDPSWPDVSNAALTHASESWLIPQLDGVRRLSQIQRIPVAESLLRLLTWQQRAQLDQLAPTHFTVPSGSRIAIDYGDPHSPVLAVRLQELFGLTTTPTVLGGRQRVTLHLLSPSQRPVQVTTDLESFWRTSYFDVRKELRGRYPKHHWPDDPLKAEPTRRTKRR